MSLTIEKTLALARCSGQDSQRVSVLSGSRFRRPTTLCDHFFLSADRAQRQGRRLRVGREVVADTARESRDPLANRYLRDHPVDEMRGRVVVRASAASYTTAFSRRGGRSLNWLEVPGRSRF